MTFTDEERKSLLTPAFCPHCGGLMKGKANATWSSYRCCMDCYIWFLEGRPETIERWKAGWRPSPEQMAYYREMMKN